MIKRAMPIVLLLVALSGCVNPPPPPSDSMNISPSQIHGHMNDMFAVTILLNITQPIKAWEATIAFNAMILQVVKVEQGDLFGGSDCFQSKDILIDNTHGSITGLYALTLGDHAIVKSGSLVKITFMAETAGDSDISLVEPVLYNATESIPIEVGNATAHIIP